MKNVPTDMSKQTQWCSQGIQELSLLWPSPTILNVLVVCSFSFGVERVRNCIFRAIVALTGVWLAILQLLALAWSHRTWMEGSELRGGRLWLCKIESSKTCNAKVRMSNSDGAKGSTENARNINFIKKKHSESNGHVRKKDEKFAGSRNPRIAGGRRHGKCSKYSESFPKNSGKSRNCFGQIPNGKRILLSGGTQDLEGGLFRLLPLTCTGIRAEPDRSPFRASQRGV